MNTETLIRDRSICTRRERRYKVSDSMLRCEVALEAGGLRRGSIIDLSTTGLRMVCEGRFAPGQAFSVELSTDRSHGIYRGVVRRVEPWVDGKSVLGCSLTDPIPNTVLESLSAESIVDRRSDNRVNLQMQASISWQLQQGNVHAELRDLSSGGMRLSASRTIPEDTRIRIQIDVHGEAFVLEGRPVWQTPVADGFEIGVAFTDRDAPRLVSRILGIPEGSELPRPKQEPQPSIRRRYAFVACATIVGYWAFLLL